MTRYGEATTILGRLPSGQTVTMSLYKASDGSSVDITDTCTEIGTTGVYRWSSSNITTQPTEETEYFYRMVTGDYQYEGKFTLLAKSAPLKGVKLDNFEFLMTDSTNHNPATGLTVTAELSKDGGAFAAATNAVTEVANGVYKINLTATEMDADVITLKATASGADQTTISILTGT